MQLVEKRKKNSSEWKLIKAGARLPLDILTARLEKIEERRPEFVHRSKEFRFRKSLLTSPGQCRVWIRPASPYRFDVVVHVQRETNSIIDSMSVEIHTIEDQVVLERSYAEGLPLEQVPDLPALIFDWFKEAAGPSLLIHQE